jgi:superfamily II DNA or RNA helicase
MTITKNILEKLYYLKEAETLTPLQPHQQRVVDKIRNQRGLVIAHGLGSGKGYSALASQDALGMSATVVTPAGLKSNFKKEYDKHILNGLPIEQQSLESLAKGQELKKNPLLIVDEAHKAKNPSSKSFQALKAHQAEKLLLLTGTPFYKSPENISPLVNLASGENLLPEAKQDFEKKYIYNKTIQPS